MLSIDGTAFRDRDGRQVVLRGLNLSGDSKLPSQPDLPSREYEQFWDGDHVSFVGRPFPLDLADEHLGRIKSWGFNTVRFLVTWEAIEHEKPGVYDEEYIDYVINVLLKCREHGLYVLMDPHQDTWSRFTGGSGAPMWTLYACGLNPLTFFDNEAALVHNVWGDPHEFPKMVWATNYNRLACETLFTLFFAGEQFAPKATMNGGENIQSFLQRHYFAAFGRLAERLYKASNGVLATDTIVGWESMNEPNTGFVGHPFLATIPKDQRLRKYTCPTAFASLMLGMGYRCTVDVYDVGSLGPYKTGSQTVDPQGLKAWLPHDYDDSRYGWTRDPSWKLGQCLWAQHGVWDTKSKALLKPGYFSKDNDGEPFDQSRIIETFFMEYFRKHRDTIRQSHPNCISFCQPPVLQKPPVFSQSDRDGLTVYSPHYYDGITLLTRKWSKFWNVDVLGVLRGRYISPMFALRIGEKAIRNCLRDQLDEIRKEGLEALGDTPCFFSEIGVPFDLEDGRAYHTGDYFSQISALDANFNALEGTNANFAFWQYSSLNTNEWGDFWNGEDFSLFSNNNVATEQNDPLSRVREQVSRRNSSTYEATAPEESVRSENVHYAYPFPPDAKPFNGCRAHDAYLRPSPSFIVGDLKSAVFNLKTTEFTMEIDASGTLETNLKSPPTGVFVPRYHFPGSLDISISSGECVHVPSIQLIKWWHGGGPQTITVSSKMYGSIS